MCAILAPDHEVHFGSVCGGGIIPRQRRRVPRSRLTSKVLVLSSLPRQSMTPWLPRSCCFSRGDCGITVSMWRRCNHCTPPYLEAYRTFKRRQASGALVRFCIKATSSTDKRPKCSPLCFRFRSSLGPCSHTARFANLSPRVVHGLLQMPMRRQTRARRFASSTHTDRRLTSQPRSSPVA